MIVSNILRIAVGRFATLLAGALAPCEASCSPEARSSISAASGRRRPLLLSSFDSWFLRNLSKKFSAWLSAATFRALSSCGFRAAAAAAAAAAGDDCGLLAFLAAAAPAAADFASAAAAAVAAAAPAAFLASAPILPSLAAASLAASAPILLALPFLCFLCPPSSSWWWSSA